MTHAMRSGGAAPARGFTLIELLVTMTIVAVLAAVAAPSFRSTMTNARLKSHNSALQESLMLARGEAINRQARVVVCRSADQATCAGSGDWQQGWIVFVDSNDSASVDAGEPILQKVGKLSGSFILKVTDGNVGSYVSYTNTGAARLSASQTFQSGTFALCQPGGGASREIDLFTSGRLGLRSEAMASCTAS